MEIQYNNCEYGIGIRIIGGIEYNGKKYSIFIREVLQDGLAYQDGRLNEGDQLLAINDISCLNLMKEDAIELLRNACASGSVKLLIKKIDETDDEQYSDDFEKNDFIELLKLEKLLNIGSDDEEDIDEEEDEDGLNGVDVDNEYEDDDEEDHTYKQANYISNSNNNIILQSEEDDEEETKIYDENDDRYTNEISDSNSFERNSNLQKLMTSQYLSDQNLNYDQQSNSDEYYMRANKAALLEQQYLNLNESQLQNYNKINEQLSNDLLSYSQEREALIDEIKRLENELVEKDKNCSLYKDQLFDLQQKVCEYLNEIMQLRSKLSIAEECQKEAIKIEQEYKQIIKFLKMNLNKTNSNIQRTTSP